MKGAGEQFQTLRFRGGTVAVSTATRRAAHAVKLRAAGELVPSSCAMCGASAVHKVLRSCAQSIGPLSRGSSRRRGRFLGDLASPPLRDLASLSSPSLEARSSASVGYQSGRSGTRMQAASDRVSVRRANYAFEPSVMRVLCAPRARRKYAPAALDPAPRAAAQRGRYAAGRLSQ